MPHPYGFPDLVLDKIFKNLDYKDLRRSRLVCKRWNDVISDYHIAPKTSICFHARHRSQTAHIEGEDVDIGKLIFNSRSSKSYFAVFNHALQDTPFEAFIIKGQCWMTERFTAALKAIENSAKELSLTYITLLGETKLTTRFKLDIFNPANLTKLYIRSDKLPKTEFEVDGDQLVSIKILILYNCSFTKREKKQIYIKEIHLENVSVDNSFILKEAFNFTEAKKIALINANANSEIFLDLSGPANLKTLELFYTAAGDWMTSTWKVENCIVDRLRLTTPDQPRAPVFPGSTTMDIKCLTVKLSVVDLSYLPSSVEKLILNQTFFQHSDAQNLTNLKSLELLPIKIEDLQLFSQVSTLTDLTLESPTRSNCTQLNMELIPQSVRRLTLEKINIVPTSNQLQLDCLILKNYSFQDAEGFIQLIKTKQLIISNGYISEYDDNAVQLMLKWQPCVEKFIIGQYVFMPVERSEKALMSTYVDKKAPYYVFQDGKGVGISAEEFNQLKDLK